MISWHLSTPSAAFIRLHPKPIRRRKVFIGMDAPCRLTTAWRSISSPRRQVRHATTRTLHLSCRRMIPSTKELFLSSLIVGACGAKPATVLIVCSHRLASDRAGTLASGFRRKHQDWTQIPIRNKKGTYALPDRMETRFFDTGQRGHIARAHGAANLVISEPRDRIHHLKGETSARLKQVLPFEVADIENRLSGAGWPLALRPSSLGNIPPVSPSIRPTSRAATQRHSACMSVRGSPAGRLRDVHYDPSPAH